MQYITITTNTRITATVCQATFLIMKYTIKELKHLRNIRAIGYDNKFYDDKHNSDRGFFEIETENFFNWLEKMEKTGKINELLASLNVA